jgi:hypothetical protein
MVRDRGDCEIEGRLCVVPLARYHREGTQEVSHSRKSAAQRAKSLERLKAFRERAVENVTVLKNVTQRPLRYTSPPSQFPGFVTKPLQSHTGPSSVKPSTSRILKRSPRLSAGVIEDTLSGSCRPTLHAAPSPASDHCLARPWTTSQPFPHLSPRLPPHQRTQRLPNRLQ